MTIQTKFEIAEALLKDLKEASYLVLVETNGVSDNEWHVKDGIAVPEFPVVSFYEALDKLNKAYIKADEYFNPKEAERTKKWKDACATASFITDLFKKEIEASGSKHLKLRTGSLHRNIADAIYGSLIQTAEERKNSINPVTMNDKLNSLVETGKLFKLEKEE